MRVAIFGLGLVGGSLGLALKGRGVHVTGIELAELVEHAAVRAVADEVIDASNDVAVRAAYAAVDLCVLAAPVSAIVNELPRATASAPVVTDTGSTKRAIAAAALQAPHFVPGHPMAGGSESGAEHARSDLFRERPWILCPEGRTTAAIETTQAMLALVGAELRRSSVEEHDRAVAFTSHAPQLLASLLVVLAERRESMSTAGAGFWTMTQNAGASSAIWRDILATNGDFIAEALRELGSELSTLATDPEAGLAIIEAARRLRGGASSGSR